MTHTVSDDLLVQGFISVGTTAVKVGAANNPAKVNIENSTAGEAQLALYAGNNGATISTRLELWNTNVTAGTLEYTNASYTGVGGGNALVLGTALTSNAPVVTMVNGVERERILAGGNHGVGTPTPAARFEIAAGAAVNTLRVTGTLPTILNAATTPAASVEFKHSNDTQGVGVAYDGLYAAGTAANQSFTLMQRGTGLFRKIWQGVSAAIEEQWSQAALAIGSGVRNGLLLGPTATLAANHYLGFTETVAPLNVRQQWDITTNDNLVSALRLQPDMAAAGNTTLYVGEQRLHNRKIVLWDGAATDTDQFYGFGVNANTLRYQCDSTAAFHRFYARTGANASNMLFSIGGLGNVTVDPAALCAGGFTNGMLRFGGEAAQAFVSSKATAGAGQGNLTLGTAGVTRVTLRPNGIINLAGLPVFATDVAAGVGLLVSGDLYRNAAGVLSAKL